MKQDELDAIRARCEAATPGPWDAHANLGYCGIMAEGDKVSLLKADGCTFADGAFIAHARGDVPTLLDEVERLRAENCKLRAELLNTRELLNMALNGDAPICPVCGEPMTRRNDDGTLGCNLCYAEGR